MDLVTYCSARNVAEVMVSVSQGQAIKYINASVLLLLGSLIQGEASHGGIRTLQRPYLVVPM